jgi:hypothetical protein
MASRRAGAAIWVSHSDDPAQMNSQPPLSMAWIQVLRCGYLFLRQHVVATPARMKIQAFRNDLLNSGQIFANKEERISCVRAAAFGKGKVLGYLRRQRSSKRFLLDWA